MSLKVLVVGSGAIGLRTAVELLRNNIEVVLRSACHPLNPDTCSMGAGGLWMPYKCSDQRVDRWSSMTLDELLELASNNSSIGNQKSTKVLNTSIKASKAKNMVEIVPTLYLTKQHSGPKVEDFVVSSSPDNSTMKSPSPLPMWTTDPRISFQHLSIEMLHFQNQVYKLRIPSKETLLHAGYSYGWLFRPPIVDPPRMLSNMLEEIQSHPLTVDVNVEMGGGGYSSMEEMAKDAHKLGCGSIINCTGLGSKKLIPNDDEPLIGGRGILLHYNRDCKRKDSDNEMNDLINDAAILTEDGPWGTSSDPCYIIPRGDIYVVGGTYHEGSTDTTLNDSEKKRLRENSQIFGIDSEVDPVGEWAGFRPCRQTVRLEVDTDLSSSFNVRVIHSYGHGGSGWTTYVGVAQDTVKLLQ
mmetsp:Transcript_27434/g.42049  ORF Transcript_27434/g.42049 Transcript_27434/m.42049 type:complete len:410 (-) Transcript_27434:2290-3519(-)